MRKSSHFYLPIKIHNTNINSGDSLWSGVYMNIPSCRATDFWAFILFPTMYEFSLLAGGGANVFLGTSRSTLISGSSVLGLSLWKCQKHPPQALVHGVRQQSKHALKHLWNSPHVTWHTHSLGVQYHTCWNTRMPKDTPQ